jgi:GntR family transcriptional regulator
MFSQPKNDSVAAPSLAEFQPLYAQVKNLLVKRIGSGAWKPGELLPSEYELAAEYNVSQGTVRKAMMALEADRLIVRRQGRGTYVARHTSDDTLFHFFRMVGLDDRRLTPSSVVLRQCTQHSTPEQAALLSLSAGEMLHAIVRVRHFDGVPAIFERIFVPVGLMPNLKVKLGEEMDEEMYVIYQDRFGISIARATERLAAVAATAEDALHLRLEVNAPLLQICRIAHDVNGSHIELRVSRCNTTHSRYAAEVN